MALYLYRNQIYSLAKALLSAMETSNTSIDQAISSWLNNIGVSLSDDARFILLSLLFLGLGFLLGRWLTSIKHKKTLTKIKKDFHNKQDKQQDEFDQQMDQLQASFAQLSQQALNSNNQSFLVLAREVFGKLQSQAENKLDNKERSFSEIVKPIQESLKKTDEQLKRLERDRAVSETKLSSQIEGMLQQQQFLQTETRNLSTALRRPEVRGQWGELTLKRLAELAGMSEQ